uniref:Late embryogenesis abundant protein LEA-2 subgroup domain-containing protein n=1 Tax=Kalanchoe fedtschenkoi TaxID=63787 RepID=A0A7N0VII6_KALFE
MAEDNQRLPLAPFGQYGRSDQESPYHREERPSKWFALVLTAFVSVCAFLLIFAIIFLKASYPRIRIRSITVTNLHYSATAPSPSLNASFTAQLAIRNNNFGHFKYDESTAVVLYGGVRTGEGVVGRGRVAARSTKKVNLAMEVRSERMFADERVAADGNLTAAMSGNLSRDLGSGVVEMIGFGVVAGKVYLLDVIRTRKVIQFNCSISLDVRTVRVQKLVCR